MDNLDSLAESIGQLYALQNADNDQRAVELYRAMFRNDKDINKLDFNYADHLFINTTGSSTHRRTLCYYYFETLPFQTVVPK